MANKLLPKTLQGMNISPDGRFISYRLSRFGTGGKATIVPSYVTETGFTTDINARTKVGTPQGSSELYVYDRERDTIFSISLSAIPGIEDLPDYLKEKLQIRLIAIRRSQKRRQIQHPPSKARQNNPRSMCS